MEWLPALRDVAFDTLAISFMTDLTLYVKLVKVELTTVHVEFCVVCLEPYVCYPVYASNVHPLLRFQINHRSLRIGTQHANRRRLYIILKQVFTARTKPRRLIIRILLIKISSVARRVYNDLTEFADCKLVVIIVEF